MVHSVLNNQTHQHCNPTDHDYKANYQLVFARDENEIAFRGEGEKDAAIWSTLFCSKCGDTREVQLIPRREHRYNRQAIEQARTVVATAISKAA